MARSNGHHVTQDIKHDLDALRQDVMALTAHVQANGQEQIEKLGSSIKATGNQQLRQLEKEVKAHPNRSVITAFCAGLAASYILGRKQ